MMSTWYEMKNKSPVLYHSTHNSTLHVLYWSSHNSKTTWVISFQSQFYEYLCLYHSSHNSKITCAISFHPHFYDYTGYITPATILRLPWIYESIHNCKMGYTIPSTVLRLPVLYHSIHNCKITCAMSFHSQF